MKGCCKEEGNKLIPTCKGDREKKIVCSSRSIKYCGKKDQSNVFGTACSLREVNCRERLPEATVESLHGDL